MNALKSPPPLTVIADELGELYRKHHEMILRTAYRITRNMGDAEDVLHSVFIKLMQKEIKFEEGVNPGPYLHRTAVNAAIDMLRRRQRIVPLEAVSPSRETTQESPFGFVSRTELGNRLRAALATLPDRLAEVFVLRFVEGYSNQEIGRLLGIHWGTVAVTIHRARHRLQKELLTGGRVQ
jgi:RNA polymerase sigma-70 factor, ECF subfamily